MIPPPDDSTPDAPVSRGVEELIERLRLRGIDSGKSEAERIVAEARTQAGEIVAEARREAESLKSRLDAELRAERVSAEAALELAKRDALLTLGDALMGEIADRLRTLIRGELDDRDFLRRLILALAARTRDELPAEGKADLHLPAALFDDSGDTGSRDEEQSMIRPFILRLTRDALRDGVEIRPAGIPSGFTMRFKDDAVQVDFTEETLTRLLAHHLTPRFRRLFKGFD